MAEQYFRIKAAPLDPNATYDPLATANALPIFWNDKRKDAVDADTWLQAINGHVRTAGYRPEQAINFAASRLGGAAQQWLFQWAFQGQGGIDKARVQNDFEYWQTVFQSQFSAVRTRHRRRAGHHLAHAGEP